MLRSPGGAADRPRRLCDRGHVLVIEAFLAATVLLSAASFVAYLGQDRTSSEPASLDGATDDALRALHALRSADKRPVMDALVEDAWRCAEDAASSGCSPEARAAADSRLRAFLPPGVSYEMSVTDGAVRVAVGPTSGGTGPSSSAAASYVPEWSYGLVVPTLSCQDEGVAVRVEALFLRDGNAGLARGVSIALGAAEGAAAPAGHVWSATPAADVSASTVRAIAATRHGEVSAEAPVGTCVLDALRDPLQDALAASSFGVEPTDAGTALTAGADVRLRHDLSGVAAVDGVTLRAVTLDVFAPASGAAPMWTVPLGDDAAGDTGWRIPMTSLHGCYPLVLRVEMTATVDGSAVEVDGARLGEVCVTLAHGRVAPEPTYRVSLRTWTAGGGG